MATKGITRAMVEAVGRSSKRKASPAQIAARKLFAQRARAGTLRKNPARRKSTPTADRNIYRRVQAAAIEPGDEFVHGSTNKVVTRVSHAGEELRVHFHGGSVLLSPYEEVQKVETRHAKTTRPQKIPTGRATDLGDKFFLVESSHDKKEWRFVGIHRSAKYAKERAAMLAEELSDHYIRVRDIRVK